MRLDQFRERLLSLSWPELEAFIADVLRRSKRFTEIETQKHLGGTEIDIAAKSSDAFLPQPTTWYFEVTTARTIDRAKLEREIFLRNTLVDRGPAPTHFVLVALGGLTPAARETAEKSGLVIWDAMKLLELADPELLHDWFGNKIEVPNTPDLAAGKAKALSDALRSIIPGNHDALIYQRLIADVLTYLFCPPLEAPRYELSDIMRRDRRDMILENSATDGFWAQLRERYHADYVVVDSKNYNSPLKKRPVIELAHYLKPYGCGMFGMLVTRSGASEAALHAMREQWVAGGKMVVLLNDSDLLSMLAVKGEGGSAEELIRSKIADFRMLL